MIVGETVNKNSRMKIRQKITLYHKNGLKDNKKETKKKERKTIENIFRSERKRQGWKAVT